MCCGLLHRIISQHARNERGPPASENIFGSFYSVAFGVACWLLQVPSDLLEGS